MKNSRREVFGDLMEAPEEKERAEKIQLGKIIAEEFVKLLERKISETDKKRQQMIAIDRLNIEETRSKILPEVEKGNFNLIVQPAGLIVIETANRRIALSAPNQNWDREFKETVKSAVAENKYAKKVFEKSEMNKKQWETKQNISKTLE